MHKFLYYILFKYNFICLVVMSLYIKINYQIYVLIYQKKKKKN